MIKLIVKITLIIIGLASAVTAEVKFRFIASFAYMPWFIPTCVTILIGMCCAFIYVTYKKTARATSSDPEQIKKIEELFMLNKQFGNDQASMLNHASNLKITYQDIFKTEPGHKNKIKRS